MNKIKSTLFLALVLAITATSTFAGQIPIMGRPDCEADKTTATTVNTTVEPENEIPSEISNYLWTFAGIISQLKF